MNTSSTPNPTPASLPVLAIVGRPNVGKSSLFNRIVRRRKAIVHEASGVTRDRVVARARWRDRLFLAVDTGGLGFFQDERPGTAFDAEIRDQLMLALEEADAVVFVVEATVGVQPLDEELAALLRPLRKHVVVAVNKADNTPLAARAPEHFALGIADVLPISAAHGGGIGDLLDVATDGFPVTGDPEDERPLNIAVVGRPNVGKSSSVNRLLGETRAIVSDVPGTTRDAVDVRVEVTVAGSRRQVVLVDTAGLRRRAKVDTAVEFFSASRAREAIRRADIVFVVLDANVPVTAADKRICRQVVDAGKPCLLLANKWDEACRETKRTQLRDAVREALPWLADAQIINCCAVSGYNFSHLLPAAFALHARQQTEIPTSLVNRVLQDAVARTPPPSLGGATFKVYYGVHKSRTPPTFLLFVNREQACPEHYRAYLKNRLREAFDLRGLPVTLVLKNRRPDTDAPRAARRPSSRPGNASKRRSGKRRR